MCHRIVKKCVICGVQFASERNNQKYCSIDCAAEANRLRQEGYRRQHEERKRRAGAKNQSLTEINCMARAEGLTYGQYVAKYGI